MKHLWLLFLLFVFATDLAYSQGHVKVRGYYRSNGTYVRPHYRTAPNSTNRDNFSTRGNVNPYTGKRGYVRPDSKPPSGTNTRTNTAATNNDILPSATRAAKHRRSVARPAYTTSATPPPSHPTTVTYAPLSSAQPGNCTMDDRKHLIDSRYVVEGTYLVNRPTAQGQPMLKLNFGDKVNILCHEGRWYEVVYQGMTGWVEERLVKE